MKYSIFHGGASGALFCVIYLKHQGYLFQLQLSTVCILLCIELLLICLYTVALYMSRVA